MSIHDELNRYPMRAARRQMTLGEYEELEDRQRENDLLAWHEERWRRAGLPGWRQVLLAVFNSLGRKPPAPLRVPKPATPEQE